MKFLVTTDGSGRSLQALPHAVRLARVAGADLLLVRVLDPLLDCGASRAPSLAEATAEVASKWMDELQQRRVRGWRRRHLDGDAGSLIPAPCPAREYRSGRAERFGGARRASAGCSMTLGPRAR